MIPMSTSCFHPTTCLQISSAVSTLPRWLRRKFRYLRYRRTRFRDIRVNRKKSGTSAGLGFPALQCFSSEYEPDNLLLRQAYQEVMDQQMEKPRLRDMLERDEIPDRAQLSPNSSPFCFPIKVRQYAGRSFLRNDWRTVPARCGCN